MERITQELRRRGRITFEEFMSLALYDPEAGYYTAPRRGPGPVGPEGDFVTAPTASPLFARTLARLLTQLAERLEERLTLVELAAGEGTLIGRLRDAMDGDGPLARVVAVERAGWARQRLRERAPGVEAVARLSDAPRPHGPVVLFASELYDALPVRRVTMRRVGGSLELAEFWVEQGEDGALHWAVGEPADGAIEPYLAAHNVVLDEGQVAEVRPNAESLHAGHLAWCGRNMLALVLDYGYPARQLYNSRARRHGTLVGYRGHTLVEDVLEAPGEIDLTAHVNFDDLTNAAVAVGCERGNARPLGAFLALHGALDLLPPPAQAGEAFDPAAWAELSAAKRVLAPGGMGSDLKVLAHGKGPAWLAYAAAATPPPQDA